MMASLFGDDGKPKMDTNEALVQGDTLYIIKVVLEKRYRGYGVGLLAVDGLISSLPSFDRDNVILTPASLQRTLEREASRWNRDDADVPTTEASNELETQLSLSHEQIEKKLIDYWSLLGFQVWSKADDDCCTLMGMWTGDSRPSIEDVMPHLLD